MVAGLCRHHRTLLALFIATTLLIPVGYATADIDETGEQLSRLKSDIVAIQSRLSASEKERDTLQSDLRDIDLQISASDIKAAQLNGERSALKQTLQTLEKEGLSLRADQEARVQLIEQSIQHLWAMQQGGELRVWLGDQPPEDIARHMTYLQILVQDQQNMINHYEQGLRDIERNVQRTKETQSQLAAQAEAARDATEVLTAQRASRQRTLQAINAQVSTDEQQLAKLKADQQRLNQLFEELVSVTPAKAPATMPFAELKGLLAMPVSGVPSNRFGARRNADIRWQGWMIPAEEGAAIRAVHAGQVIYADWLRGQGLLIVVDHQDGWLTLYAQNHTLMRQVGESVMAGEVIARAGASGGQEMAGLYFEIRQQGQPVDPAQWIRR